MLTNLLSWHELPCLTVYSDTHYQLFYNEKCNAVYDKHADKVYELSIDGWTNMVLKIAAFFPPDITIKKFDYRKSKL